MCPTNGSRTFENPDLRTAFDVLDADRDGKISYDDLRAFYGGRSEEEVIGSMISAADSNKNGYVEYEEFERVVNGSGKKERTKNVLMEEAFRVMDKDGDGKVGLEDLKSYLTWAGFEASDDDVRAMIGLASGNGDEAVTLDSFLKILAI